MPALFFVSLGFAVLVYDERSAGSSTSEYRWYAHWSHPPIRQARRYGKTFPSDAIIRFWDSTWQS